MKPKREPAEQRQRIATKLLAAWIKANPDKPHTHIEAAAHLMEKLAAHIYTNS